MTSGVDVEALVRTVEAEWLERWGAGPVEAAPSVLGAGATAPDAELFDDTGRLGRCPASAG